jgi:hypothetical protein
MRKPKTRPEITEPRDYALSTLGYPTMRALPLFDAAGSRPKEQLIRARMPVLVGKSNSNILVV